MEEAERTGDMIIRVTPLNTSQVMVEWAEPAGKASKFTFEVIAHCRTPFDPPTDGVFRTGRRTQKLVFGNLDADTAYDIRFRNEDLGWEEFSDRIPVATLAVPNDYDDAPLQPGEPILVTCPLEGNGFLYYMNEDPNEREPLLYRTTRGPRTYSATSCWNFNLINGIISMGMWFVTWPL